MYISQIQIQNYRCFIDSTVEFNDGLNILIGQNNAGKSNLLRALAIIFDSSYKRNLSIEDFSTLISLENYKEHSPKIVITVIISQSSNENFSDEEFVSDDLVAVSDWLITLKPPYQAQLKYEYFLPAEHEEKYREQIEQATNEEDARRILSGFLRYYVYKIWAGDPSNLNQADREAINKFDFQFLDAIRDVERDMFSGRNLLLKQVLEFCIDFDLKLNSDSQESTQLELERRKKDFDKLAKQFVESVSTRLEKGQREILNFAHKTGATFDNIEPKFIAKLSEGDFFSILQLAVKESTGIDIPITNNGLGYNNLIFMSLLLAKMKMDSNIDYLGSNAKVFPMLVIEEPEAHLHPTMQAQFVNFVKEYLKNNHVRQVFITSHSTHITSSANLDDLICLYKKEHQVYVAYPGKVFKDDDNKDNYEKLQKDKKFVQRFLDATKSNMLFAERIILVEGITEQLLLPILAEYKGVDLEKEHVAVINVGGRFFDSFLHIFNIDNNFAINRKIACITDLDPCKLVHSGSKSSWKKCYPFEKNDTDRFENNPFIKNKVSSNIRIFTQDEKYGKTFEYQLVWDNPTCKLLIPETIKNKKELEELMDNYECDIETLYEQLRNSQENTKIIDAIKQCNWAEDEKKRALFASRYLNSIEKGENALDLSVVLFDNLTAENKVNINVPRYITDAIKWVCDND